MIDALQIELIASEREVIIAKKSDERFEVVAIRGDGIDGDVPLVGEVIEKLADFVRHTRAPGDDDTPCASEADRELIDIADIREDRILQNVAADKTVDVLHPKRSADHDGVCERDRVREADIDVELLAIKRFSR